MDKHVVIIGITAVSTCGEIIGINHLIDKIKGEIND
jgi:hypothetical protein